MIHTKASLQGGVALIRPVLNMQTRHPGKLARIIGNKYQFAIDRLCRDQRIQRTSGRAGTLELRPNLSVGSCITRHKFQDGNRPKKILHKPQSLNRRRALGRAGPQFGFEGIDAGIGVRSSLAPTFADSKSLL